MRLVLAAALALLASPAFAFSLTSPDVSEGATFPTPFVCPQNGGHNVSPALNWTDAPAGTKSFAVTIHDPDAPVKGGFWHWLVADIPADATGLAQNAGAPGGGSLPAGSTPLPNGAKQASYLGPCPPAGKPHHYEITVWALPDAKATLTAGMTPSDIGAWLAKIATAKATLTPIYAKP